MAPFKSLLGLLSPKKNKERVQVQLSNSGNGFTIPFKNGDITIPDQADGYGQKEGRHWQWPKKGN